MVHCFRSHRALLRIMDQSDNDLQGTEGSGSSGGPDVRRRIPLKLISKQPVRSKPVRVASFACKQEERVECKSGDAYASHRRYPQQMFWDYKLNLIGEKDESPMHFCDTCGLPIRIYGRMIPCKHVFCYECAVMLEKRADKLCPGVSLYSCTDAVQRIEQCLRGSLFMCSVVPGCKRTYLSQRDLQAHINHRHLRSTKPAGRPAPPPSSSSSVSDLADRFLLPPPAHLAKPHLLHKDPYCPPPHDERCSPQAPPPSSSSSDLGPRETYRIATVTIRKHSNLITVPIQDDSAGPAPSPSSSDASREPRPQPGPPPALALHHPLPGDYAAGPVVAHGHHLMAQQQHYRPPPLPTAPMTHPLQQHSSPGPAAPHMMYNQAPPLGSAPPPITPPPGHIINPMPPYMNRPPPGSLSVGAPPPHHYNPGSLPPFSEDQGALSPPFSQPGAMSPGIWPTPRGPHPPPPRMQGPPPQGPLHPDQSRFRPYYQ